MTQIRIQDLYGKIIYQQKIFQTVLYICWLIISKGCSLTGQLRNILPAASLIEDNFLPNPKSIILIFPFVSMIIFDGRMSLCSIDLSSRYLNEFIVSINISFQLFYLYGSNLSIGTPSMYSIWRYPDFVSGYK